MQFPRYFLSLSFPEREKNGPLDRSRNTRKTVSKLEKDDDDDDRYEKREMQRESQPNTAAFLSKSILIISLHLYLYAPTGIIDFLLVFCFSYLHEEAYYEKEYRICNPMQEGKQEDDVQ